MKQRGKNNWSPIPEQRADFDLPVGFGHAHCMSNLKVRYVEITHSHEISICQSSNNWTCAVQIIVSAAVLKLGSSDVSIMSSSNTCIDSSQKLLEAAASTKRKRTDPASSLRLNCLKIP